jgi:lipopolysaccharide export system protein LptA
MLRLFFIVNFILVLAAPGVSSSASVPDNNKEKQPVVITSRSLTADNKEHVAVFEGSVVAKTDDLTIYSDRMTVYSGENGSDIQKLHASGNVKVQKNDTELFSDDAVYFGDEEKIVFSGNPKAVQKGNVITGSEIVFFIKDDRAVVQQSRVILQNKKGLK